MLPGLSFTGTDRVYTLDIVASVENVKVGQHIGASDYLDTLDHPIDLHVQVRPGVVLGAALNPGSSAPQSSLSINLPTGSRIFIKNLGRIAGGGGIGGNGDRSRRDTTSPSSFVGGGGGGGAGSTSQGGAHAVESDPDATAMTDGAAGTGTNGGAGGTNDFNGGIGNSPYVLGTAPQRGGDGIYFGDNAMTIIIDNEFGEIFAGADGGVGGWQDGSLPGGANSPVAGEDLAASATTLEGSHTTEPRAVAYASSSTLEWSPVGGSAYPKVAGFINRRP